MLSEMGSAVFQLLGYVCHQLPERSLFLWGAPLPLCIRCLSVLAGTAAVPAYLAARLPQPSLRVSAALLLPLAAELSLRGLGLLEGANGVRALTGLLCGFFSVFAGIGFLKGCAGVNPAWRSFRSS